MATTPKETETNDPTAAKAGPKAPRVKWDDSNMRSSYANVVNATS